MECIAGCVWIEGLNPWCEKCWELTANCCTITALSSFVPVIFLVCPSSIWDCYDYPLQDHSN